METVIKVNERGTLTLPKEFRRKLGLEQGGQVILDDIAEGVRLRAGAVVPVEIYTNERIQEFEGEDAKLAQFKL